ncbi:MAG: hypothetical protein EKK41_21185 [Hyphomicrobiales bacterium]|nr:MAG: hypothetical protein EKK41_21185 [Hyphomicrobiales bacterium]
MATPLMGYVTPTTGGSSGTWGDDINNQFTGYVDSNLAAISTLAITGATYALSASEARSMTLRITGTLLQNCTISAGGGVLWNGVRMIENLTTGNFTITLSNAGGSCTVPQGHRGVFYLDTTFGPRAMSDVNASSGTEIPSGSVLSFYQAAAPTGWTQVTSLNDCSLRLVSGTGGGIGGSVNFSTLFGRTSVDGYVLQVADIPSHKHGVIKSGTAQQGYGSTTPRGITDGGSFTGGGDYAALDTVNTGGGGSHTHGLDMRVKYADFIVCSRN